MPTEGIASGDAIAMGSTAATLHSIAAVGLGHAGSSGAMSVGNVIGETVLGIATTVTVEGNCNIK